MANTLPGTIILPDPLAALPGLPIRAAQVRYLAECLNLATAELHAGVAIQQTWLDDVAAHGGAIPVDGEMADVPLARWRVPVPSSAHLGLRVMVRAEASDLDEVSTLTVTSTHAADSVSAVLDIDDLDEWTDLGTLDIAEDVDEPWEDVELYLETGDVSTTATVVQIVVWYAPLTSPLAAAAVSGAVPFGVLGSVAVDQPLPAVRGHQLRATLEALYARPRVMQSWSDLASDYSGVHASQEGMPAHAVITVAPAGPGREFTYAVRAGALADAVNADIVGREDQRGTRINADVGDADTWLVAGADAEDVVDDDPDLVVRVGGPVLTRTMLLERLVGDAPDELAVGPSWVRAFSLWGP